MTHKLLKYDEVFKKEKLGIKLDVYPSIGNSGIAVIETKTGHNQEFYHKRSSFNYIVLTGAGSFFLDDEEVRVVAGDMLSVQPGTRIYYKGKMRLVLITNPAWTAEDEVETKATIW